MSKRLVWICWKDIRHPEAGGAELVHHELSKRLVRDGWEVIHLVPGFKGCTPEETIDGIRVIRVGSSIFSFYQLPHYFRQHLRDGTTFLVDAFISLGSFACLSMPAAQAAILVHHIEDIKWFYQTRFYGVPRWVMPLFMGVGYFVEKVQLWLLAKRFRGTVITVSESTAGELVSHGFRREQVRIISEGIAATPLETLSVSLPKEERFTVLLLGPRSAKRPMHTVKAFERFQSGHPESQLWIAGWGNEVGRVQAYVERNHIPNVVFWGRVSDLQRDELLQRAQVLCTSPLREGWGLIVIEANAMGTPVLGYDVPGLRDALAFGNGRLCAPNPAAMAEALAEMATLVATDQTAYTALRQACLESSRTFTFERAYGDFIAATGL